MKFFKYDFEYINVKFDKLFSEYAKYYDWHFIQLCNIQNQVNEFIMLSEFSIDVQSLLK